MYERATISIRAEFSGTFSECNAVARVYAPDGTVVGETDLASNKSGDFIGDITFDGPKFWWPIGYRAQPLYSVELLVSVDSKIRDHEIKQIGFREVKTLSPFEFIINNVPVRLWGANLEPVQGISHCWNEKRMDRIIELAMNGNLNSLRVWGGGEPLDDAFYSMADKAGLLLWQEFYYNYGMYPDANVFREECRREVTQLIKAIKHHPSILFWCGGNESQMGADFDLPGKTHLGGEMFEKDFRNICVELDPDRWYHPNSPYGGKFANDPLESLLITSDLFARSVELSGGDNGMEFGWLFDDNYFDLFPFEVKRGRILRKGKSNLICAKANYSTHISKLTMARNSR